jgi:hypothetical protein
MISKRTGTFLASAAAVALGVSLLPTAALAQVTPLGNLDPDGAGSYNETVLTGAVDVDGTFDLTKNAMTALSATIAVTAKSNYTPGDLELFKGATLLEFAPLVFGGSQYTASFSKIIGPGDYTAEVTGTVNVAKLGVGGTVTTSGVPEPATWVMMLFGFMGLGYSAFRPRKTKISMLAA